MRIYLLLSDACHLFAVISLFPVFSLSIWVCSKVTLETCEHLILDVHQQMDQDSENNESLIRGTLQWTVCHTPDPEQEGKKSDMLDRKLLYYYVHEITDNCAVLMHY